MTIHHTNDLDDARLEAAQWRRSVRAVQRATAGEPHYQMLADQINDVLERHPLVFSDGWTACQVLLADGTWQVVPIRRSPVLAVVDAALRRRRRQHWRRTSPSAKRPAPPRPRKSRPEQTSPRDLTRRQIGS